jgi:hypothetical protein
MGRLLAAATLPLLLLGAARAGELDLSIDMRAVSSDGQQSRLNGGLGKLRFDSKHDSLRVGTLRLGYRTDLASTLQFTVEAISYADHDVNPLDLTEIYAEWRPLPSSAWRSRLKVGAFYPQISLENRMKGWRSPYTLTFSAINSWVGEELRTIGAEYSLDWLGFANGHDFDISSSGALFGWNDPAGTVLASRGWGLTDRQSTLFGRFDHQGAPLPERTLFYHDLDRRAGYYLTSSIRYRGLVELRALHYDNRANYTDISAAIGDSAWRTYFESVGARWTPTDQLTLIAQRLRGRTLVGMDLPNNAWDFHSEFLLASWQQENWRVSARFDRFRSQQTSSNFYDQVGIYLGDSGRALTVAIQRNFGAHWNAVVEGVEVKSDVAQRAFLGIPTTAKERQWQIALRYER